jgi:hypothetical protein
MKQHTLQRHTHTPEKKKKSTYVINNTHTLYTHIHKENRKRRKHTNYILKNIMNETNHTRHVHDSELSKIKHQETTKTRVTKKFHPI